MSDEDHDREFSELSDRIWGAGNWVVCHECPPDDSGHPVRHHKIAHGARQLADAHEVPR